MFKWLKVWWFSRRLSSCDWQVREGAAYALDKLGSRRAVEPLIKALGDDSVRRTAARALGHLGDPRAVEPLIKALGEHSGRQTAAEALGQLGDPRAVEPLIRALGETYDDDDDRKAAAEALGQLGDPRAVEPLIRALGARYWVVRKAAASALGQLGDPRAVEPLVRAMGNRTPEVRRAVAEALCRINKCVRFKPSDIEGLRDVAEIAIFHDRLEVQTAGQWITIMFDGFARRQQNVVVRWVKRSLGRPVPPLIVGVRDYCTDRRYVEFYTRPKLKVYTPPDCDKQYEGTFISSINTILRIGGYDTRDMSLNVYRDDPPLGEAERWEHTAAYLKQFHASQRQDPEIRQLIAQRLQAISQEHWADVVSLGKELHRLHVNNNPRGNAPSPCFHCQEWIWPDLYWQPITIRYTIACPTSIADAYTLHVHDIRLCTQCRREIWKFCNPSLANSQVSARIADEEIIRFYGELLGGTRDYKPGRPRLVTLAERKMMKSVCGGYRAS